MFSDPVVGKDFFGREDVLETLTKRLEAFAGGYRQNVALIGHAKLGKTSILQHVLHTYRNDAILPVYVELKTGRLETFVDQFIRSVLFEYLRRKKSIDATESFEALIRIGRGFLPGTAREIDEIKSDLRRGAAESAYSRLFELTSRVRAESGQKCVVILDEFHRLGEFSVRNPFQNFGKRIMLQKDTLYLISSSSFTLSRLILSEKLALLFGNFERIYLEPFSFDASRVFIERRIEPVRMSDDLKKYLIALTDGHPFFLNVICSKVKQAAAISSRAAADGDVVIEALKELFFDAEGILNQYFLDRMGRWTRDSRASHAAILVQLAAGVNKLRDLPAAIGRSTRDVSRNLKDLVDAELVVKNGVFYHFHDKLFRFWLRHVYRPKELSLIVDPRSKAANFRLDCRAHLEAFLAAERLAPRERILNLLRKFRNEVVEFEAKGRQLPAFQDIGADPPRTGASSLPAPIIARTGGQNWVCQVQEDRSTEKDVLEFIRHPAAQKSRPNRKVIFALAGMDHNAKLLAKNKKIWTLSLQKINVLMDFYGQQKIIAFAREAETAARPPSSPG